MRYVLPIAVAGLMLLACSINSLAQSTNDSAKESTAKSTELQPAPCSLTMGWEPWKPYQFIENNKLTGFDIELISAIFKSMDCSVKFKQINWARGLVEIRSGKLDLLPHADYTDERSKWATFSDSYRDASQVLYVKQGHSSRFPFKQLDDIIDSDFRLGVGRGVFIGDKFAKLLENPAFKKHVYYIPTDEMQQYQMLQAGRIDGYIRSITALETITAKMGDKLNLEIHPLHILTSKQHVIFSQQSVDKSVVDKFNIGLKKVVSSGIYTAIENSFLK